MGLHWTLFWWSCTIDRRVAGLEHSSEVRVEVIDLEILLSEAKRKRSPPREKEEREGKEEPRGALGEELEEDKS